MYFIDLQQAYDTVDCILLWQVLTRIGVPQQLMAVIRQFHDGMGARVRLDHGVCSDWFEVAQGLPQRYVLSPLLFNIFTVVPTVALQGFSEDTVILAELVHMKESPTSMRPEPAMDYIHRAVWGILYVDGVCIASRSSRGFAKMLGSHRRGLRSLRFNCVGEEDRKHVHASTAYTAGDDESRSGRANLQTGAILHLSGGCSDQNPGHVR